MNNEGKAEMNMFFNGRKITGKAVKAICDNAALERAIDPVEISEVLWRAKNPDCDGDYQDAIEMFFTMTEIEIL